MKKIISIATAILAFASLYSKAEVLNRTENLDSFHAIKINNSFDVTLREGDAYSISYSIDSRLVDYCKIAVQGGVLSLSVDEKSYPKELKAQLRKEKTLLLQATIILPSVNNLQSVELNDNSILVSYAAFKVANSFGITASGTATLRSFIVESPQIGVTASKKSVMNLELLGSHVQVNASNSSNLNIKAESPNLDISAEGSTELVLSGSSVSCKLAASGSSKVELNGSYEKLSIDGKNFAKISANSAPSNDVDVNLASCDCNVNATHKLRITLTSGAKLVYEGNPRIEIEKIQSSTVLRSRDVKKK